MTRQFSRETGKLKTHFLSIAVLFSFDKHQYDLGSDRLVSVTATIAQCVSTDNKGESNYRRRDCRQR
jgi:hypothetical protein